jgi:hypothetical protein
MAESNYGSTFTKGATSFKCMVVDFPEQSVSNIDGTNHASNGIEERFPGKLKRWSESNLEVVVESGVMESIQTEIDNSTVSLCTLRAGDVVQITVSGFLVKYNILPADVGSEDIVKASLTWQPTGAITVTSL